MYTVYMYVYIGLWGGKGAQQNPIGKSCCVFVSVFRAARVDQLRRHMYQCFAPLWYESKS